MFSIIGITGRVGGGAASRLLGMGTHVALWAVPPVELYYSEAYFSGTMAHRKTARRARFKSAAFSSHNSM